MRDLQSLATMRQVLEDLPEKHWLRYTSHDLQSLDELVSSPLLEDGKLQLMDKDGAPAELPPVPPPLVHVNCPENPALSGYYSLLRHPVRASTEQFREENLLSQGHLRLSERGNSN